jgi:hypothetical protein
MKEVDLRTLIDDWIKDDDCLSKHVKIDGDYIMEICRNDGIIRLPMSGRVYAFINVSHVSLYQNYDKDAYLSGAQSYLSGAQLSCTMPSFFTLLRAVIRKMHNSVGWCGETITNSYLVDPNDNPIKHD